MFLPVLDTSKAQDKNVRCRCGTNRRNSKPKKEINAKRKYTSKRRCKCVNANIQCGNWCNCEGECGGGKCGGAQKDRLKRVGRKRSVHQLQSVKSHSNSKGFMESRKEDVSSGQLNMLEYVVVCAIIMCLEMITNVKIMAKDVKMVYDSIVSFLELNRIPLPLTNRSITDIEKGVRKAFSVRKTIQY